MTSLREIGVLVVVALVICSLWYPLVIIALRAFGLPVRPGFGKTMRANNEVLRGLGKAKFIFIKGVLLWRWPVLASLQLSHFVEGRMRATAGEIVVELLIWSAAGVSFGSWMWAKSQP
jgi:hypothetical protein